jgi:hypothetical protein
MPLDANIALQAKSPDFNQSFGQAIQTATGLQALQNSRLQNQIGQAQLQSTQNDAQLSSQLMGERSKLTSAMQDPSAPFKNEDGTIDYGKLQNWAAQNTPLIGTQYADKIQQAAQNVNQYKTTLSSMSNSDMDRVNAVMHSFMGPNGTPITDPNSMISQLNNIKRTLSGPGAGYVDAAIKSIQSHSDTPQNLQTALGQLSRDTTAPSTQATQLQGATGILNNGAMQVPVAMNGEFGQAPGTLTGTPGIPNQLGPDSRQQVGQNPLTGGPTVTTKDANGNVVGVTNAPTQGVYVPQPGDAQALPVLQAERDAARATYNNAGLQHTNNQIILQNIDSVGATGKAGNWFRNIASGFGFNPGDADKNGKFDPATAYDLVGKGLERSALQAAQSMGPQTNAGLSAQVAANGSTAYTPAAIKEIAKLNDAIVTGSQSYQPGLERAISANPSAGVFAKRQFDQQWGANFDPTIFQYYNAIKSGDAGEQAAIIKKLGGTNSDAYKKMMQKAKNLQSLSNTGSIE